MLAAFKIEDKVIVWFRHATIAFVDRPCSGNHRIDGAVDATGIGQRSIEHQLFATAAVIDGVARRRVVGEHDGTRRNVLCQRDSLIGTWSVAEDHRVTVVEQRVAFDPVG